MSGDLAGTAVVDDDGQPRVVYHGTSRQFDELDADAQEEALLGRAFYFTEDRDVARGSAEMRHIPPISAFDNDEELAAFLEGRPGWEVVDIDRPGGKLVFQFRNDEHRPTIIHAHLQITRPLDLDAAPDAELLTAVRARLGAPAEDPRSARALFDAMVATYAAAGDADDAATAHARELLTELGYDGLTFVDRRHGADDRVWVAFDAAQIDEVEREVL